jgi:hypothetical protein
VERERVDQHLILGKARGRAMAKLATSKVVVRKALEGERVVSHLISIGWLVYVPVAVPRVDAVIMSYHWPLVGPRRRIFPDRGNGCTCSLGVRAERLFLQDR